MYSFSISETFLREYDEKWSGEIVVGSERRLKDYTNEEIKTLRSFYKSKLQKVDVREYKEILNSRGQEQNKPHKMVTWLIFLLYCYS